MRVIELLTGDHLYMRQMVAKLQGWLKPLDAPRVAEAITFFEEFADLAHQRVEDEVVFRHLASAGAPGQPLRVMTREHELSRQYLAAAKSALPAAIHNDPEARTHVTENLSAFAALLGLHMKKEELVLFPLLEKKTAQSDEELYAEAVAARRVTTSDARYRELKLMAERAEHRKLGTAVVHMDASQPERTALVERKKPATNIGNVPEARTLTSEHHEHPATREPSHASHAGSASHAGGAPPSVGRVLYDDGNHQDLLLHDFTRGLSVQANVYLIIRGRAGIILDPGGPKVYPNVFEETRANLGGGHLRHIFLSHQDPDIGTSLNSWLMDTGATAWVSRLWTRFLPHFGIDRLLADRLRPIPDEGMVLDFEGADIVFVPAHFLHSPGNFQLYDPVSKILFSGDLGASVGVDDLQVTDFDAHVPQMIGFHKRYMASGRSLRAWAKMVRELDIRMIAPQHGAIFEGESLVSKFIDWCENLETGTDLFDNLYKLPSKATQGGSLDPEMD
ncbi:MAG: hemerythrin domain-containing protein [Deltaproteobacteria bacterium]|nr:hemerythrin domain-containing protein [Deltaproteobacteria bacterium]